MTFACSVLVALAVSTAPSTIDALPGPAGTNVDASRTSVSLAHAAETIPVLPAVAGEAITPDWAIDRPERRPGALPAMYATLGLLQALDVYSTRRAIGAGASEANPLMRKAAGASGAMLAVKALSTAGTIYFTERAWKKNRKGAIILMAIVNGATAAIAIHNFRNARR